MEDRKLSEKESLDIITQMINSSKRNMKVGSGNVLLYWGYFTVLLSVVISSLILCTQNYIWSWGWMLMFAVGPVISYKQRGCDPANRSGLLPGKPLLDLDITSFIKFVQLDAEISCGSARLLLDIDKLRLLHR